MGKAWSPTALDDARWNGRAGEHRRDLAPEHGSEHGTDVDGGEAEPDVAPRAVDPGDLAFAARLEPVEILGEVHRGLQGPRLAAGAVGVGRGPLVLGEERSLGSTAAQRVGDAPADLGTAAEQLGQLAVVHGRPSLVVQDARPDPITEEGAELIPDRRQGIEQIGIAGLDESPGRGHERTEPAGGHLHAEARRHDLLELVRLVENDHVVLGEHHASARQVRPVEVGVDHDDVGHRRPFVGGLGEAATTGRTVVGAGALPWADADHVPGPVRGLEAQVRPVAAVRLLRPGHQLADFFDDALGRCRIAIPLVDLLDWCRLVGPAPWSPSSA